MKQLGPWVSALGCLFALAGCGKAPSRSEAAPAAGVSVTAAQVAPSAPPSSAAASPLPAQREPVCRALRVEGEAQLGELALVSGTAVDGSSWLSLAKGTKVTLKHSASGREWMLVGPARLRACRRGREQLLLAQGQVTVSSAGGGLGARPGAEVALATPVALLRYADADFTLTLDEKTLEVAMRAGQIDVDPARADQRGLKSPLRGRDKLRLPIGKPDVSNLLSRCKEAAEAARESARRVGDPTAKEPLGERAQAHVRARQAARAACTVAAAASGLVADPDASAGFWAEAARWEGLWETIPRSRSAEAAEK